MGGGEADVSLLLFKEVSKIPTTVANIIAKCKRDYFVCESVGNANFADYFEHVQKQLYKYTDKKKEGTLTLVADTNVYTIPTDCLEVDALWYDNAPLELKTIEWLDQNYEGWRDGTVDHGVPVRYVVDKGMGKVYLHPAPDSTAIADTATSVIKYVYNPTALPTDGTGSVGTPTEWDDIYVHYALWQVAENYRDFTTATRRSAMYHSRLREVSEGEEEDQTGYVETTDVHSHTNWRVSG